MARTVLLALAFAGIVRAFVPSPSPGVHPRGEVHRVQAPSIRRSACVSLAGRKPGKPPSEPTAVKKGIEPKYLVVYGLVAFGVLYDFFVTHGGVGFWDPNYVP